MCKLNIPPVFPSMTKDEDTRIGYSIYNLVIFDLDGTLLNTLEDLAGSLNRALSQSNYPERSLKEIRSFIGNGIRRLVERGVPEGTSTIQIDKVFDDFKKDYDIHCQDKTRPYNGISELLHALRATGCKTAVVSNKSDGPVHLLCSRYFPGLFDSIVGERPGVRRKPFPDSVNEVLRQLNVERKKAIYVGDSEVDIETAHQAGMEVILVEWGFRDATFLRENGGKTIVSDPKMIANYVLQEKEIPSS